MRRRRRNRGSRDDEQVRRTNTAGLTVLDEHGERIHVAPAAVTASIRYLLARIQLNDAAGLPRRMALTSALRGEGVTFITRTLGAVIAHDLKKTVCVVDLNWWSMPVRSSDAEKRFGIADVVRGQAALDEVLMATDDPALWLASAGEVSIPNRPVLAKDDQLDHVLDELSAQFDHLLLELPAVLETSDALTLVRLCDAYAMVVHQGVTTEKQVRQALDELSGAVSLGVVLNRSTTRIPRRLVNLLSQ